MNRSVFSTITSQIPFVNHVDGNRVQMASSMIRQSQLLTKAELPYIITEHSPIRINSFSIQIAPHSGNVIDKFNDIMLVQYDDGTKDVYFVDFLHTTKYRIGDRFNKGNILVYHKAYEPDMNLVKFGVNVNVMFSPIKARTYEDAVVLTQSGVEKFEYVYPVKYIFEFYDEIVETNMNMVPGNIIKQGDTLITKRKFTSSLMSIVSTQTESEKSKVTFEVTKVKAVVKDRQFLNYQPEQTKEFFEKINTNNTELDPLIKKANCKGFSFDGKAYLVVEGYATEKPRLGDKFANPYGNKGCLSFIAKDFKLIDPINKIEVNPHMIHTPVGVPSRMNVGQIAHMALGYLLKYIIPLKLKKYSNLNDKVKFLLQIYYVVDPTYAKIAARKIKNMNSEEVQKLVSSIETNGLRIVISQFTYHTFRKLKSLYNELNVPTSLVHEKTGLRYGAGVIYAMLLEHLIIKKLKARSVGAVDSKTLQPSDGQRMGEMEMWTLASHNAINFLKESLTVRSDDIRSKKIVIRNLIRYGKSGMPKLTSSPTFDLLKAYLTHMGIELIDTTDNR